jgi:thiol:disulfide interchange protein DsbA
MKARSGAACAGMAGMALLFSMLLLTACGGRQQSSGGPSAGNGTAPPAAPQSPSSAPAVARQVPAVTTESEPATITRMNEDGSETVEETTGDNSTHNSLLAAVMSSAAAATTTSAPTPWQEGLNYTRIVPAQPTSVPPGDVEVLEFFWYACPHCYELDPLVESWRKTKAPYINFSRVPVTWSEGHRGLARLYSTLDALGKLGQLHSEVFKEIHVKGDPLVGSSDAETEHMQTVFVQRFGITADAFHNAYHSFGVETNMQRADQLTQRYRITAVPTFVVNGKYVADVATAGGQERLFNLINDLAAIEHKH